MAKSKQKFPERNGNRWSFCYKDNPAECSRHFHDDLKTLQKNLAVIDILEEIDNDPMAVFTEEKETTYFFVAKLSAGFYVVDAFVEGEPMEENEVGFIIWDGADEGRIEELFVVPEHRRKGLATSLWNEAIKYAKENYLTRPVHSESRTEAGEAWAKTTAYYFEPEIIIDPYTE